MFYEDLKNGDLFLLNIPTGITRQIAQTNARESDPVFNKKEDKIIYTLDGNLFSWEIKTGEIKQLIDLHSRQAPYKSKPKTARDKWLSDQQLGIFKVLKQRKDHREEVSGHNKDLQSHTLKKIYTGEANTSELQLSPDENYITYILFYPADHIRQTQIPKFVTESRYTEISQSRPKGDL